MDLNWNIQKLMFSNSFPLTLIGTDRSDFSEKVWMMFTVCNLFYLILQVFFLRYKTKMYFRFKFIFSVSDSVSVYRPPMNLRQGKAFSHVCQSLFSKLLNLIHLLIPWPSPLWIPLHSWTPPFLGMFKLVQLDLTVQGIPLDWLESWRLAINWKAW